MAAHTGNKCPRNCLECGLCGANTVVVNRGESYAVRCAACEWTFENLEKRSFAAQVLEKRGRSPRDRLEAIYLNQPAQAPAPAAPAAPAASTPPSQGSLPRLVQLRSRCQRACKACRHVLVQPMPQTDAKFEVKSMALSMVPRVSVYNNHLLVVNALSIPVKVTLSSSQVVFASSTLDLGPLSAHPEDVHELRQVPEELIERETEASRQVFMSGVRKATQYGASGPNWAATRFDVGDLEADPAGDPATMDIYLLLAVRYEAQTAAHQINLWVKWRRRDG